MNKLIQIAAPLACALLAADTDAATLLLKNAVVHTVSGPTIERGQVLISDGKISKVGGADANFLGDEVIDLQGQHLYPGMINASSSLGLVEITGVRATRDMAESGSFTPDVQAWRSVDPDSELIAVARANGVTHSVAVPAGGTVTGLSGMIQLGAGWTMEDLTAKGPAALHLFWPDMRLVTRQQGERAPRGEGPAEDREGTRSLEEQAKERRIRIKQIEDFFSEAEAYAAGTRTEAQRVPAWEAMTPVVKGEIPLVIHADSYREIKAALEFASKRFFKVVLAGGKDAARFGKELAAAKVPVIFERIFKDETSRFDAPMRDTEAYDTHFATPGVLSKAGVKVAITEGIGGNQASDVRNMPYAAAQAVAFGMDREEALKSITLYPAEMYGVSDRLGSIAEGREASLFSATGDILDIRSQVTRVWIKGMETSVTNKQVRLYERYRSRPKSNNLIGQ